MRSGHEGRSGLGIGGKAEAERECLATEIGRITGFCKAKPLNVWRHCRHCRILLHLPVLGLGTSVTRFSAYVEFSSLLICCSPKLLDLADLVRGLNLDMGSHFASAKDAALSQLESWFQTLLVTVMKWSIHRCEIREGELTGSSLSFSPKQRGRTVFSNASCVSRFVLHRRQKSGGQKAFAISLECSTEVRYTFSGSIRAFSNAAGAHIEGHIVLHSADPEGISCEARGTKSNQRGLILIVA